MYSPRGMIWTAARRRAYRRYWRYLHHNHPHAIVPPSLIRAYNKWAAGKGERTWH